MTQARLNSIPPEGHGITGRMLDRTYADLTSGRDLGQQMLMVGIAVPVGTSQRRTAKGIKRFVTYEFLRLEPILDVGTAEQIRFALSAAYERRTSQAKQLSMEYDGAPEIAKRREIFAALSEWREDQDVAVTEGELGQMWRDYIQPVEGAVVPALAHSDTQSLLQFAYHIGALVPEKLVGRAALPDPSEGMPDAVRPAAEAMFDDDEGKDGGDGEPPSGAEPTEPEPGSVEEAAADATEQRGGKLAAVPDPFKVGTG